MSNSGIPNDFDFDKFSSIINSPEHKNYMVQKAQENIMKNLTSTSLEDIPFKNPMAKTEQLLEQQLTEVTNKNSELQEQLDKAYVQLKQLNDKESVQNQQIKELRADLEQESLKRELAETKLSSKDWKLALISGAIGLIVGIICAWYGFSLTL